MQLTRLYTLKDFTESDTAKKFNLDNTPNALQVMALSRIANLTQEVSDLFCGGEKLKILSGFRSSAVNKRVGGATYSQHTKGEAVDFKSFKLPHKKLCFMIVKSNLVFDQIILEPSWIHLSVTESSRNRREFLIKTPTGYIVGTVK